MIKKINRGKLWSFSFFEMAGRCIGFHFANGGDINSVKAWDAF